MIEESTVEEHTSKNFTLAKVATAMASVISAQNQLLMQMTDRIGEAGLISNTTDKDTYFATFNKILNETSSLNALVKELIVHLQEEDLAMVKARHEK